MVSVDIVLIGPFKNLPEGEKLIGRRLSRHKTTLIFIIADVPFLWHLFVNPDV